MYARLTRYLQWRSEDIETFESTCLKIKERLQEPDLLLPAEST